MALWNPKVAPASGAGTTLRTQPKFEAVVKNLHTPIHGNLQIVWRSKSCTMLCATLHFDGLHQPMPTYADMKPHSNTRLLTANLIRGNPCDLWSKIRTRQYTGILEYSRESGAPRPISSQLGQISDCFSGPRPVTVPEITFSHYEIFLVRSCRI